MKNRKLEPPTNQWALAVWYLIKHPYGITMEIPVRDFFYKWQTRILEIEKGRKDKLKIRRLPITIKNRFKHNMTVTHYKSLAPKPYLENLYRKLNAKGIKALHN